MNKLHIILLFILGSSWQLSAQSNEQKNELIDAIVGKWKVIKYQSQSGKQSKADMLIFESDGTFKSDSIYFATKEGLFRTDESQTILILENGNTTTEWTTSLKNGVLRMRSVPKNKQPKTYITAVRVKDEV
jgi:hypothetical protein